ncbi:deoxyribonuclease gamma-like [Sparus aurata]|uniref:deoxyribonuclease gamma-like n=1 Tax=Sparus aurata TaxID=8175 RepID=UPI0011C173DF|nr:deoxyribonuclease gamma-like [Sparus aurata]
MKIAAFNVKNLGWKKVTDETVVRHLTKIMSQYSVVVILEVNDKSGKAMEKLHQELNSSSWNRTCPYSMIVSSQLGRDTYKEQFVCFYRIKNMTDGRQMRQIPVFREKETQVCWAVDQQPLLASSLSPVVFFVFQKIMILGDFNADGRYLSKKKKGMIRICSAHYHWLIEDDVDTTSSNLNDHTYDRIVVYGQTMLNAVVPGSAKSFNFQREFKLTDEETLSISDHYPVEVELKTDQKHKAPTQRRMVLTRTEKTTSNRQTQKTGPQKKKV